MAGNVKEWVSDWGRALHREHQLLRPGSHGSRDRQLLPAPGRILVQFRGALRLVGVFRQGNNPPSYRETDVGFRCVRPPM
ncbi:MAG: SUMF1/EgtB/PvdO family nonheme iron enzyme [Deltaproteobacteria bacterium]|nr:SUMF1/EgtB/PvdO family nonheme iron enzyme [Deltaproteobacteria bacterium]